MSRLNLCLHERDSGRLVIARDRFGIKPLYLAEVSGGLRFASSLPGPEGPVSRLRRFSFASAAGGQSALRSLRDRPYKFL